MIDPDKMSLTKQYYSSSEIKQLPFLFS